MATGYFTPENLARKLPTVGEVKHIELLHETPV
jgi:hypothetical protein